jgi:HPt (histidine-containing phosphotransfer) domain-containing protein
MYSNPHHLAADQPILDVDHFAELCDMLGNDQTESLLRTFLVDLDERVPSIIASCEAGEHGMAKRGVHGLKGAALSIGACRIAMIAASIERADDEERQRYCYQLPECATATRNLITALLPAA